MGIPKSFGSLVWELVVSKITYMGTSMAAPSD